MIPTKSIKKQCFLYFALIIGGVFSSYAQEVAPFTARLDSGSVKVRGDIVFVGNNILNRATEANPEQANTPYSGNENNNSLWMEYIDIDGDSSTFSSSSAELNITDPACSQVRYAGLYWAATYPNERSTNGGAPFSGTPRIEDWFNIKFKVPGGSYVALTADTAADAAGQEDDIIYDGYDNANINNSFKDSPYICYKNVTDLVRSNPNPNGGYTVANVRATKGKRDGSSSAGWIMVIIYENPNESGKFISIFDGYAGMSSAAGNVDVAVNGFRTLPNPFPVRARIGVGALEGDRGITNDRFFIKANSNGGFTNLSTGQNPADNFFNSTITTNGVEVPTRNPYGTNTMGTDLDLFNLNNPSNSVLPNDESGATLRFTSTGDGYGSFLAAFAVEIIEPNIVLEKRVEDIAGNDITDGGVNLGQTLDYVLSFRNLGNDQVQNYTIRDVLPTNTRFVSFDVSGAPGVTGTYDAGNNEIDFSIPDNLVEIGDPAYTIRLRVQVASNCYDFVDACSDQIRNLAYSTYRGEINSATISDDPSVSDFDNCGFATPGATNFLLDDLSDCNFSRTVQLCGANVVLVAGEGFNSYVWARDDNNNGQIDSSEPVINDGDPDNDPSTLLIDDIGIYIVDKIIPDPCKGFMEIITVERFGSTQTNPIIDYFNELNGDADPINDIQGEIVTCSIDGDLLPKIFLCGTNDTQSLQVNITDAQGLSWEKLDESSCSAAPNDCANKNLGCSWSQVASGNNYTADTSGKYRLVINYTNGCFSRFYFDVFQNTLDIQYNNRDIICARDGRISITNLGSNYGFQLVDHANNSILVPFSAGQGPSFDFGSGENGSYRVEVVQLDGTGNPLPGACIFSTDPIGIRDRDFQVDITTTPANCNAQGSIKIDVLNVRADYTYRLLRSDGTLIDDETAQPNNTYTFTVNPGNYTIETSTADGCTNSQDVTVGRIPNPTLSGVTTANIGCSTGTIELTRAGGQGNPDFLYAIWSKDGTALYPDITSIPADAYQVSSTFNFGWRDDDGDGTAEYIPGEDGTYEFVIIDANNCSAFSNPVTIEDNGSTTIDSVTEVQPSCSGDSDGALTINISGGIAPYGYSIDNGATYQTTPNFINLSSGTYNIRITDTSGCDLSQTYSLSEPFPLSASAGVSKDATCNPNGAEVRITNVVGGNPPYEYSFDGGATYGGSTIAVLPPGDYTAIVRDESCEFPMDVTVEDIPEEPTVTLTPEVSYACDGAAIITATPDIVSYNYTYALDGVPNSPDPTSNVFLNVPPGTYTVSTNYSSSTPPTPSLLLQEDFGSGSTIPSPNTNGYNYEDQTPNPPGDGNSNINDFEYSVTSDVVAPFGSWVSPIDHTSGTRAGQGRYLVMNVGTPTPTQIIYSKEINDIIPGQDLSISFYVMNLLRQGTGGLDPDLTVEVRELGTGNIVQSVRTGAIAKNTGNLDWKAFSGTLNPNGNTSLEFVIRSEITGNGGNDFALDDIEIFQVPEVCEMTVETPVTVEAAKVFSASITASSNVSCNGQSDATITFEVENFDATTGFEYSIDGGASYTASTTSPVTTTATLNAGTHDLILRKVNEPSCSLTLTQTITQPTAVFANAAITTPFTCNNTGATITASAADGIAPYEYRLEDVSGGVLRPYQTGTAFNNVGDGNYIVRARDGNGCEDEIDAPIAVTAPAAITFTTEPTLCYSGAGDAAITVNVSGGNGGLLFSINGSPFEMPDSATPNSYVFDNLGSGSYTVNVQDQLGCTSSAQTVTIAPEVSVTASAAPIPACGTTTTVVTINAAGGDTNFVYALVADGVTPAPADFNASTTRTISATGNYDVYVRDKGGNTDYCEDFYDLTVTQDSPFSITASNTPVLCSGASQANLTITPNGGGAPYTYSINDGATYQTSETFSNLPAGSYNIRVRDVNNCEATEIHSISEPFTLSASALVAELIECNPTLGAEVRIVNARGGTAPYEYSFDGGVTYQAGQISNLFPGDHDVFVRDANNCTLAMQITVLPPQVPPGVTTSLAYFCDGDATITVNPDDPAYTYTYEIDNVLNIPADSNVFTDVAAGDHVVTVNYVITTVVPPSTLLTEDFGFGSDTPITEIDPVYCYEPQNGSPSSCPSFGTDTHIQDGEYTVTQALVNPYGTWVVPNDHTGNTDGRYLGINVGGVAGVGGIVYAKRNIEVLANQDISISMWAINLLRQGTSGGDPSFEIQLVDSSGTIIASTTTGNVPKNTGANDWRNYSVDLNPGANTNLDIVIRTNSAVTDGNDIAIDDILATQPPVKCPAEVSVDVLVEAGKALEATITATSNVSCNGVSDGSVTFNVENFNNISGFEYSLDGGTTFTGPLTTPSVTINGLSAGTVNIEVRDVLDNSCTISLSRVITQPSALVTDARITAPYTCDMPGATITASATGGTPTYEYQLENTAGTIIAPYQIATTFTNVAIGDYIVRGRDDNGCVDPIDALISIVAPSNPTFTAVPTTCYSGNNDATIQVDVTSGNSSYQFNLNGGPWLTPSPSTGLTYTFQNLSGGTYTINVKDKFGCIGTPQNIAVNPQLTANAVLNPDLTCLMPASVTITANGGSGTYSYEWSDDSGATYASTNFTGNVFNTTNSGAFVFRVTDTSTPSACAIVTAPVSITPADIPIITSVAPTDILCNGDLTGTLDITIDTNIGLPPYIIEVIETNTSTNYGAQTSGLPAGDYEVRITDDKGCVSLPYNIAITQPDAIAYDVDLVPIMCDSSMGTNPGSITVENLTGGTAEYTYYLTGNNGYSDTYITTAGGEDYTFAILEFGIYEVDVVDVNGCSRRTTNIIASPPDDLDIDVSTTTVDCTTGGTAIVTVSSTVGSGTYEFATLETYSSPYSSSYQAADTAGGDTATFTGLTPGITYTFVVHDLTTNCYYFETAATPINSPSSMTATLDVVSNVTCKGAADGNVSFTFDNYDGSATSVEYEIFNAQSNTPAGFSGTAGVNPPTGAIQIENFATLSPGVYYILLKEVGGPFNGCSISSPNFTITESSEALQVTATSSKNDNCNVNAGTINAQAQNGTAPYEFQYLLDTAPVPTATTAGWVTDAFANVESGNYIVYVKDANNCIQMDAITVGLDPTPDISLSIVDECVSEGTFEVTVTLDAPGLSPYQISLNGASFQSMAFDGSNRYSFTGLSSGIGQSIEVRDLNGCSNTETFDIQPPLQFTVQQTALLDCESGTDAYAEITIEVTSGSGNYEYAIDGPGSIGQTRTALPSNPYVWLNASAAGVYDVRIYDMGTNPPNCVKTVVIDVPDAVLPEFTETHTNVTCHGGADGTISLQAINNGTNPLTYSLTPMPAGVVLNGNTFENIPAGTYDVRGLGTNDCFNDIFSIAITEPNAISVTVPTVVEFGCAFGNNPNNASIEITGANGGSNIFVRYEFINNDDPTTAAAGDPITVQDGSNSTYTETNVVGGTYTINVYDNKGCFGTHTATIDPYDELLTATTAITNAISCSPGNDGEITVTVTSAQNDLSKFEYSIDNGTTYQTSNVFPNLGIGTYWFLVRHIDTGCIISTSETIKNPNTFTIDITKVSDAICFGTPTGEVTFELLAATYGGGFNWEIFNSNGTSANLADDTSVDNGTEATNGPTPGINLPAGSYYVTIRQNNAPTCTNTEAFTISGPTAAITGMTRKTDITCALNDGSIEVIDVLGGWGGYTYLVDVATNPAPTDASGFQNSPLFTSLSGGAAGTDYQVWIADSNGCLEQLPDVNLIDPTSITATLQVNLPNCNNFDSVLEVVGTSGGQGSNYRYQLQIFNTVTSTFENLRSIQTSAIFGGLGAGNYQVIVSDQWSCSNPTSAPVELYEKIVPLATVVKAIDCSTNPGGEIAITQTGGSGNFDYGVIYPDGINTANNSTGVFAGLDQIGEYVFTITDLAAESACSKTITQKLQDRIFPVLNVDDSTNVTCNGNDDGTISISVTDNGIGPYFFRILSGSGSSAGFPIAPTSSSSTSATFTGLEGSIAGITYTVEARGTNNCTVTTDVTITELDVITVNPIMIDEYGCANGNNPDNARISFVSASGGTNDFIRYVFLRNGSIMQDGANITYLETDGLGGDYEIRVYDDVGCSGISATNTVLPFVEISNPIVTTSQEAACSPVNNAEIEVGVTVSPTSATPNLQYTVTGINVAYPTQTITSTNTPETFTGMGVGNYRVSITNLDTGCVIQTVHTIDSPDVIKVIATKLTDEECLNDGVDDGSFSVAINNYSGAYDYQVFDIADTPVGGVVSTDTSTPLMISNLPGGSYYVRVTETDAPLCEDDSNIITINTPSAAITAMIREEASVTCSNDQGKILVDPTGGKGPYTITIASGAQVYTQANVAAFIFENLSAGSFHVTVTDDLGCVLSHTIDLVRPDDIVASISSTPVTCFDGYTASVTASTNSRNVTPNYQYRLNRYGDIAGSTLLQTSAPKPGDTFTGLPAGFYSITVTDEVSCSDETDIIEIINPTEVEAALIRTSPLTCTTGVEFELSAIGGTGFYAYSTDNATWNPMTGNSVNLPLSGMLTAGVYQYYVRDVVNGCTSVLSNSIEEDIIEPLTLTVDKSAAVINCNGDNTAVIYADAKGGLGNYEYSLYTNASLDPTSLLQGPKDIGEFSGLPMGTYYVEVTSGNNTSRDCTAPAQEVTITEPDPLSLVDSNDFTNVSCNGANDGTIALELTGGVGPYQYAISPNLNQFDDKNTFEDLSPGDYRIIAQDRNGCFVEMQYTITEPRVLEVTATALSEVCEGEENGSIELSITGGTAPYSTRLNTETNFVKDRTVLSDLASGSYIVFVRDAMGCEEFVSVTIDPGVNLNASVEPIYGCEDNVPSNYINIVLDDASISQEVLYALDSEDLNDMQLNPFFRDISPGTHYIAISHANGCIVTHSFEIEGYEPLTISVEQTNINELTATVNGGKEDYTIYFGDKNNGSDNTFMINRTDTYVVTVLDENGCEASAHIFIEFIDIDIPNFFSPNGDAENQYWKPKNDEGFPQILTIIFDRYGREVYRMNQGNRGWDGFYQQTALPSGDYWYIIKLNGENDDREFVGHFTLYR